MKVLLVEGRTDPEIEVSPVLDGVVLLKEQVCHMKVGSCWIKQVAEEPEMPFASFG